MKKFLGKRLSALLITVMSLSVISCPIMAEGREILLLTQNFNNVDLSSDWVTTENTGTITDVDSDLYVTNADGFDSLVIPDVTVTDAVMSADFNATALSTDADAYFGIRMRSGDGGSYQMAYYPKAKQLKLQRMKADGITVETTRDSCGYVMNEGETYNMAFSVKDGSLRGEVNGVVWLRAFDYVSDGNPVIASGSAAVVSNLQQVTISNPKMTGEDKLFYENFESGRPFADVTAGTGYGSVSCAKSKGIISVTSDGKLKLESTSTTDDAGKETFINPQIFIKSGATDKSSAWKHTALSFDAESSSLELMYIYTHMINAANYAYQGFVHGNVQNSKLYKFDKYVSTDLGAVISESGKAMSIAAKAFKFKAETNTVDSHVDLKYYIDNQEVMSATDTSDTLSSTGGGISINPKGTLTIDNLAIKDANAATKAENTISLPKMVNWTKSGTVSGTFSKEKEYKVLSGQNGDLVLNNFSQKNVSVGMDVDIDSENWSDNSQINLFARYISNGHNVRMTFFKKSNAVTPTVAILVCNNGEKDKKYVSMTYDPGTKFRMELQAKDGIYRALIDGNVVAELTSVEEMNLKGTVGIQFKDATATVKNVLVKEENRMWISDVPTAASKHYTFTADTNVVKGTDYTAFCADIQIPDLKWSQFFMNSRVNSANKAYIAQFRTGKDSNTGNAAVYVQLYKALWNETFGDAVNITSNINVGRTNRIKMVTEDLSDGNVKIAISVNGTEVLSKVTDDSTNKLTSASGANGYDFWYPSAPGTFFTNATAWIECLGEDSNEAALNIDYKFNKESLVADEKVKADLTVENTTGEDFSAVIFAALYNADGVLCEVTPITEVVVTAQEMYKTVSTGELTVPNNPTGYRAVAYCWNSISGMKPLYNNTVKITALEDDL